MFFKSGNRTEKLFVRVTPSSRVWVDEMMKESGVTSTSLFMDQLISLLMRHEKFLKAIVAGSSLQEKKVGEAIGDVIQRTGSGGS